MLDFFVLTFLVSIICLIVFLIKPKFRTKKFLLGAVVGILISFVLIGISGSSEQKAEIERKAKEEQVAKEKAEQKAKAEQEAKEKAEAEQKAKEEQEAKEKAEAEQKAKAEQEAKEKAEAEQKAKEEQVAREKAEAEQKAKEEQAVREKAEANRAAEASNQQTERTVYIAPNSGTKYHYSSTCRGLKRANSVSSISLSEATAQGYTLCGFED